jgi:hypothetical protein
MFTRETLRKLCEYEYAPSLVGEAIGDFAGRKETALEQALRKWGEASLIDETQGHHSN